MSEATRTTRRSAATHKQQNRLSALEKLKKVRGGDTKLRLELKEEENVYEYVDEDKYAEIVQNRRENDWIDNDGGEEYHEDGREIFDDEYVSDDDEDNFADEKSKRGGEKKERFSLKKKSNDKKAKNIRHYMINSKSQPKSSNTNNNNSKFDDVEEDEDLKEILADYKCKNVSTSSDSPLQPQQPSLVQPLKLLKRKTPLNVRAANQFDHISPPNKKRSFGSSAITNNEVKIKTEVIDDVDFIDDNVFNAITNKNESTEIKSLDAKSKIKQEFEALNDESWSPSNAINNETKSDVSSSPSTPTVSSELINSLEYFTDTDKEKYIKFYWLDAHDGWTPGTVFLFGKVFLKSLNKYVSCCLTLINIEKRIYLLPREHFKTNINRKVTVEDVYKEFNENFAKKFKINDFKSRPVEKLYAFEKQQVPKKHQYLEILCSGNQSNLPDTLEGETFTTIFGANQTSLERVILDLKLKGPSWLKIKSPKISQQTSSWCKLEFTIEKFSKQMFDLSETSDDTQIPPLTFLSLKLKAYANQDTKHKEVIGISCLSNSKYHVDNGNLANYDDHFFILCKPSVNSDLSLPYNFNINQLKASTKTKIFLMNSEREMLNFFMAKFHQIDPDIIIGHDLQYYDLDILLSRLNHFNLVNWAKLGRLRRTTLPYTGKTGHGKDKIPLTVGRLVCDTKISSKDLIRLKEYELGELVKVLLKKTRSEIDPRIIPMFYASSPQILRLINFIMKDNEYILQIAQELNILPLALQLTKIAGNILSRTLVGGRSERNEFLLLHAFSEKNYICPDKNLFKKQTRDETDPHNETIDASAGRKKAAYLGGLVLEPKIGFYDQYILLMDFNSLYPSIIQEYNICFTTIGNDFVFDENELMTETSSLSNLQSVNAPDGILPVEIRKLVDKRREVKKLLMQSDLSSELKLRYDVKQKALKLTANSMYGCLGFTKSRFYAKRLAALITYKGREVLMKTKSLVEGLGFEVIYGDTDSIMINTNCTDFDKARQIGIRIQSEINGLFKLLEIEIDGVFARMLLLKKKKYATLTVNEVMKGNKKVVNYSKELKGLDIVRRDWSIIAKKVGEQILEFILSVDKTLESVLEEIHKYLKTIAETIETQSVEDFIINKQLTKNPDEYSDCKSLTHVLVALACNQNNRMEKKFRSGDTVPYIVCMRESNKDNFNSLPATQRGFHPEEVKTDDDIKIDYKYYLTQQLFPVVSRLCDVFEGTNRYIIAELLGIETLVDGYRKKDDELNLENLFIDEQKQEDCRFATCKPVVFHCPIKNCSKLLEIRQVFNESFSDEQMNYSLQFSKCTECSCDFSDEKYFNYFCNELRKNLRNLIKEFNRGWMSCEDPVCKFRTRLHSGAYTRKGPLCPECHDGTLFFDITDYQVYLQLQFTVSVFNIDEALKKIKNDSVLNKVKQEIQTYNNLFTQLKSIASAYESYSSYKEVNLTELFSGQYYSKRLKP